MRVFGAGIDHGRQQDVVLQLQSGVGVAFERDEVDDEIVLDGEHGVVLEMRVALGEDLRGDGLVVGMRDLLPVSIPCRCSRCMRGLHTMR